MEPFIGQIQAFGFNFPPRGWAHCNGQLLPIAQNTALFSLLGTTFGGDGRTTFGLPEMRGRSIRHVGNGPGVNPVTWGQRAGSNTTNILAANMPSHNHSVSIAVSNAAGEEAAPNGNYLANNAGGYNEDPSSGAALASSTSGNTGGNSPLGIDNPFIGIYVSIALVGIFPSRN